VCSIPTILTESATSSCASSPVCHPTPMPPRQKRSLPGASPSLHPCTSPVVASSQRQPTCLPASAPHRAPTPAASCSGPTRGRAEAELELFCCQRRAAPPCGPRACRLCPLHLAEVSSPLSMACLIPTPLLVRTAATAPARSPAAATCPTRGSPAAASSPCLHTLAWARRRHGGRRKRIGKQVERRGVRVSGARARRKGRYRLSPGPATCASSLSST
jgi:hypothetical protein